MELRVEQLSVQSDVSVDTIRYYQSKSLLDPPRREGRIAWYDARHLERLGRIRSLQKRGFTLATIARLVTGELDAAAGRPVDSTGGLHLAGSLGLDGLAGLARRGSLHPLVPLPTPDIGAARLRSGITFAVAGDPAARAMAGALGGDVGEVGDGDRAAYHAAAVIAANHLVALLGQVERVAASAGLPLTAFAGLLRSATDDALALGPRAALTGPAARGDWETVQRHRTAIASMPAHRTELAGYDAMVALARRLSLGTAEELDPTLVAASVGSGGPVSAVGAAAEQVA